jgi:hypothetical protein
MSLNGCRYNSAPAMREALQHFWCAAAARSKFVSGNSQEVRSHPLLIVGISMPDGDGSVWRYALVAAVPTACQQCTKHCNILGPPPANIVRDTRGLRERGNPAQPMQESSAFVYASVLGACFSGR